MKLTARPMRFSYKVVLGLLFGISFQSHITAQTTIENFTGTDEMVVEAWFFKGITEDYRFNIFSLNEVVHNYDSEENIFLSYTVFGYDVWKGFGPLLGARLVEGRSSGLAGIQYAKGGDRFLLTTNFSAEIRENPFLERYLLTQYRFPLTDQLNFFGQFQNSTNFNEDAHSFSLQRLRVGLSWKKLQFGVGLNSYQFGDNWDFDSNQGGIARLEF